MTKNLSKRLILIFLAAVIVAAMAFTFSSCGDKNKGDTGSKTITVDVVDDQGEKTTFTIVTSEEKLAGALLQEKLVEGEDGGYGFYITTVNGLVADYEKDGAYWALQKDGELLMTGASDTAISDGDHYELVYTKG